MPSDEMNMGKAESRSNAKETLGAAIEPYFCFVTETYDQTVLARFSLSVCRLSTSDSKRKQF